LDKSEKVGSYFRELMDMRAVFIDRDGVICENRSDHVKSWDEFRFLPGATESLAALSRLGLPIIVITNQAIVNRGLVPASVVEDIHGRMMAEVEAYGGRIDRVMYCPHTPQEQCACRKPEPGMLLRAADEMGIDLSQSYMVGDAAADLMAAERAGCRPFLVLTGRGWQQLFSSLSSVNHFTLSRNLLAATSHIVRAELNFVEEREVWIPARTRSAQPTFSAAGRA
jgi:D-glycero-D-manno-heptose 1,7-bisphosphate phosphatase